MTEYFAGADGNRLAADVLGPSDGPEVLLLHGGGQTRHAWKASTRVLADRGFRAIALDLRGHGESDWSDSGAYDLTDYADDVRSVCEQLGGPVALVGASLGGLASILAAGEEPASPASALVLVDVTPRMEADGRDRVVSFMAAHSDGFATVEEAAAAVSEYLPHRPRPASVNGLRKNLRLGEDGRFRWHWDPKFISRADEVQEVEYEYAERLETALAAVAAPVLLVRGASSELVAEESVQAFLKVAPTAEYVNVAGASHMVAGDVNDTFSAGVEDFLSRKILM